MGNGIAPLHDHKDKFKSKENLGVYAAVERLLIWHKTQFLVQKQQTSKDTKETMTVDLNLNEF